MGPTLTEATPCADHRAMTEAVPLPLARFTVVEVNDEKVPLCLRLATSLAAKIAADLGADVLKIEPPGGDPVRRAPPLLPQGGSALFQFLNTSKRALVLDLKTEAGRAGLARLLDKADACLFEEPASVAPLLRRGRATPIEIAAFPVEMDAAARPVSGLAIQALTSEAALDPVAIRDEVVRTMLLAEGGSGSSRRAAGPPRGDGKPRRRSPAR